MGDENILVIYGNESFALTEQNLDRVLSLCSKKMRDEILEVQLGIGYLSKARFMSKIKSVRVLKDGYESTFYETMAESLIYALENGYLDSYTLPLQEPEVRYSGYIAPVTAKLAREDYSIEDIDYFRKAKLLEVKRKVFPAQLA